MQGPTLSRRHALQFGGAAAAATTLPLIAGHYPQALPVSARTGYGLDLLKRAVVQELQSCSTLWRLPSATSRT